MIIDRTLHKLADIQTRRPKLVIGLFLLLTIIMIYSSSGIEFDTNFENQVPQNIESIEALNDIRDKIGGATDSIIILFRTDYQDPNNLNDMRDVRLLKSMDLIKRQIIEDDFVLGTRSIADMVDISKNQRDIYTKLSETPSVSSILTDDYELTIMTITVANGITSRQQDQLLMKIDNAIKFSDLPPGVKVDKSGSIILNKELGKSIGGNVGNITIMGFIGVFLFLMIFYRRFSFTVITSIPIIFGTTWTFGTLAIVGIPLSSQITGTFAIIIGLGIDFGIHIIQRFKEDIKAYGIEKSIKMSVQNVGKGIVLTTTTTIIGFMALLAATLPLLRDFSIALSFGVFYSLVAAIGIIPPILVIVERRSHRKKREKKKKLS